MLPLVSAARNAQGGICTYSPYQNSNGALICGICYDCGESDGICPDDFSTGTCSSTADPDCCQVTSISWTDSSGNEITSAGNGQQVKMVLQAGVRCSGQTVSFDIWEVEPALYGGDDDYTRDPSATTIDSTGKAQVLWSADGSYNDGFGQGGPEYIFYAQVGGSISYGPSSELAVASGPAVQAQTGGCGDGFLDAGEDPTTCPADAGCDKGQVYCDNDPTPVCKTTCEVTETPCSQQTTCLPGLICSDQGLCDCNLQKDGIKPPSFSLCAAVDPDADDDGDGIFGDDNCPLTPNPLQTDTDGDAGVDASGNKLCDYSSSDYNMGGAFACGGDACDKDDDNDLICDQGKTSAYCSGSDLCPNTPSTVDLSFVDSDGCTEEQRSCLTQWDCSQATWSSCDESTNTVSRDTSQCSFTGEEGSDCAKFYQPESVKGCLIEAEFPVFSLMNILLTLMLISGFYYVRKI